MNFAGRLYEIMERHKCKFSIGCANCKLSVLPGIFCFMLYFKVLIRFILGLIISYILMILCFPVVK